MGTSGSSPLPASGLSPPPSPPAPFHTGGEPISLGVIAAGAIALGLGYWFLSGSSRFRANPALYGLAKRAGLTAKDFNQKDLAAGARVELEHTRSIAVARQIAMDHLTEDPDYYRKLALIERKL